jgi:hypothetical protein
LNFFKFNNKFFVFFLDFSFFIYLSLFIDFNFFSLFVYLVLFLTIPHFFLSSSIIWTLTYFFFYLYVIFSFSVLIYLLANIREYLNFNNFANFNLFTYLTGFDLLTFILLPLILIMLLNWSWTGPITMAWFGHLIFSNLQFKINYLFFFFFWLLLVSYLSVFYYSSAEIYDYTITIYSFFFLIKFNVFFK